MANAPEGYEISSKIVLDSAAIKRLEACAFAPGEEVRMSPHFMTLEVVNEEVPGFYEFAVSKDNRMVIEKVLYDGHYVTYKVEGFDKPIKGGLLDDVRDIEHHYGTFIVQGDDIWAVSLDKHLNETVEQVLKISGDPERHVAWNQGASTRAELVSYIGDGIICEFNVTQADDGGYTLVSIPWCGDANDADKELALGAIELQQFEEAQVLQPSM